MDIDRVISSVRSKLKSQANMDKFDEIKSFDIYLENEDLYASTFLFKKPEKVPRSEDEDKDGIPSPNDYESNREFEHESVTVEVESDQIKDFVRDKFNYLKENTSGGDAVDFGKTSIKYSDHEDNSIGRVNLQYNIDLSRIPFEEKEKDLYEKIVNESRNIGSTEDITLVSVRSPLYEPTEKVSINPDYTINYKTDMPHEVWVNCDTIEDYARKRAKNSEHDYSHIINWEYYVCHTHIQGKLETNAVVRDIVNNILSEHITVEDENITKTTDTFTLNRGHERDNNETGISIKGSLMVELL